LKPLLDTYFEDKLTQTSSVRRAQSETFEIANLVTKNYSRPGTRLVKTILGSHPPKPAESRRSFLAVDIPRFEIEVQLKQLREFVRIACPAISVAEDPDRTFDHVDAECLGRVRCPIGDGKVRTVRDLKGTQGLSSIATRKVFEKSSWPESRPEAAATYSSTSTVSPRAFPDILKKAAPVQKDRV
jgi:hypothetical protein